MMVSSDIPSPSRSDCEDERSRDRSATFPPRAGQRESHSLSRDHQWYAKGLIARYKKSSIGMGREHRAYSLLKSKKSSSHLLQNKKVAGLGGNTTRWPASRKKSSDTSVTDEESGSATSRSGGGGGGDGDAPRSHRNRRHHRESRNKKRPSKRQQRLVSTVVCLVVILTSVQMIILLRHPPKGGGHVTRSLLTRDNVATENVIGTAIHRRTDGIRSSLLLEENEGDGSLPGGGVTETAKSGASRTVSDGDNDQHQGLYLSNSRAFEMVAADMGHLKDTIEKLEYALTKSMGKQERAIALVMHQLGINDAGAAVSPSFDIPKGVLKELSGGGSGKQSAGVSSSRKGRFGNGTESIRNEDDSWNMHTRGKWVNEHWIPKILVDESTPDISHLVRKQRRVLLLSERRSGAGFVGRIVSEDPRVFYVGDPCRMGGGPEALIGDACSTLVTRLLACQPSINDVRNLYSFSYIVEKSRALSKFKKLRVEGGGSPAENDELVRTSLAQYCGRSEVVIVKEMRITEVVPKISIPELRVEVLLVVRDPRATIHSLSESWGRSKSNYDRVMSKNCTNLAVKICSSTERKLDGLAVLGKKRFKVLKYEMVIKTPFAMIKSIYTWLDLGNFPQEVSEAIKDVSTQIVGHPTPGEIVRKEHRSTLPKLNWATRWANEMPDFRRHQIQRACNALLASLEYEEIDAVNQWPEDINSDHP